MNPFHTAAAERSGQTQNGIEVALGYTRTCLAVCENIAGESGEGGRRSPVAGELKFHPVNPGSTPAVIRTSRRWRPEGHRAKITPVRQRRFISES